MVQISGINDRFLQKDVVLSEIMRVMEPDLKFLELIPFVDSGGQPVPYAKKDSRSADAKKQTPRLITPSSKFPEVQFSKITKTVALTKTEGLAIRLDKDAIKLPAGRDMIMDGYQNAGYWLAEYLNSQIYTNLRAGATDAGIAPTATWHTATFTPVRDLTVFKNAFKREGYPYRLTDAFVDTANFGEAEGFMIASEIPEYRNAAINAPLQDSMVIPIEGKPVLHGMFSGITHGDIFGLDRNHPAAAMFYNNDADFSTAQIQYETVVNGQPTVKTVPNFGLNTHQYFEDDTHDTVIQLWFDEVVVVKDAYGYLKDDGF
jgi:hypothetical protein